MKFFDYIKRRLLSEGKVSNMTSQFPRAVPLASGDVLGMTSDTTTDAVKNAWHTTVYMPTSTALYLVEFNSNGGTPVQSQSISAGGKVTEPDDPTKEGKTFGGWYSDLGLTDAWTFSTDTVSGNMMLYASWS